MARGRPLGERAKRYPHGRAEAGATVDRRSQAYRYKLLSASREDGFAARVFAGPLAAVSYASSGGADTGGCGRLFADACPRTEGV